MSWCQLEMSEKPYSCESLSNSATHCLVYCREKAMHCPGEMVDNVCPMPDTSIPLNPDGQTHCPVN